ncbi:MAG: glycosyltransferase family 2 protein [Sulfurimonas sp.]|nr:glycosyltransferase family 2 protein [Sulfurimonas sp.]
MNNIKPYFSVVIPLYNKRPHIKRSVFSVLNQTYENFELIVVDDGSTDGSLDELKDIEDKRLKIYEKENGGASSARNYGIRKATANYVAFLDADDEWNIAFLETIIKMYTKFPNKGIYTTAYELISGSQKNINIIKGTDEIFKLEDYFKEFVNLGISINNSSTTVVRKDLLFVAGLFPEQLKNFEDFNVWFKIALLEDVIYNQRILSYIHLDAVNRSNHGNNAYYLLISYSKLVIDIEKFIVDQNLKRGNIDLVFQHGAVGIMRQAIKAKEWNFFQVFKKSELYNYINFYQKIFYMTNINRIGLIIYKILTIFGLKK